MIIAKAPTIACETRRICVSVAFGLMYRYLVR